MNKKIIISIVAVIILALIGGGAFWYAKNQKPVNPLVTENKSEQNASSTTESVDTSDWQTYQNEEYGFEVMYPREWYLYNCSKKYNRLYVFVSDEKINAGCSANRGRINIMNTKNDYTKSAIYFNKNSMYNIKDIIVENLKSKQINGSFEIVGGEGEQLSSEPQIKTIETYIPHNNEFINIVYYEIYKIKENSINNGFKLDKDLSSVYMRMLSTFQFN